MTKPVIAVDFDDVVAGFHDAFLLYHNNHFGTDITYEGITSYDMSHTYGTDMDTILNRISDFYHNHHHTVSPLPDAIENLRMLKERYQLEIVTSRCEAISDITTQWNRQHAPDIFSNAHYANGFGTKFPERKRSKLEICREINAIALIDDALSHVNLVATESDIRVFLPNRPWNQDVAHTNVTRVTSWGEITKYLLA